MRAHRNILGNPDRIAMLENAVKELRRENAELRTHLWAQLETKINDQRRLIQDSIRIPRDGKDGMSVTGPQGPAGPPGDVLYITPAEVTEQVQKLRKQLAKWQAAIKFAYEQNYGPVVNSVLKKIEIEAR